MTGHLIAALRDQLADARCALRDSDGGLRRDLLTYAEDCIRRAERLGLMMDTKRPDTYAEVRKVLEQKTASDD